MNSQQKKIEQLKEYFKEKDSVILAFVFGSISKGNQRSFSDWDIAVYFKPYQSYRETLLRFAIGFLLYPPFIEKTKEFIKLADK